MHPSRVVPRSAQHNCLSHGFLNYLRTAHHSAEQYGRTLQHAASDVEALPIPVSTGCCLLDMASANERQWEANNKNIMFFP
jgi:hypothetical protein